MELLKELRERESSTLTAIDRIMATYIILESHLASGFMTKEEMDCKYMLRSTWKKLLEKSSER
eukprot:4921422-Prorocentrum_lima.AAC.1